MDSGKECPPQVICHMLPEQLELHQCSVSSALHGNDHGAKVLVLGRGIRGILRDRKTWCASGSSCVQPTQAMVSANKGVQVRDLQGRIWGSVVRLWVMSCVVKCRGTDPPPLHHTSKSMGDDAPST